LPGEHHFRPGHAGDVLLDEAFQLLVRHPARAGVAGQRSLAQVKAVAAIQVASGAAGLGHDVKPFPPLIADQRRRVVFVPEKLEAGCRARIVFSAGALAARNF